MLHSFGLVLCQKQQPCCKHMTQQWRHAKAQMKDTSPLSLQAIRVFFMLRSLSLQLQGEPETQLPLTRPEDLIKTDDVLDLSKTHKEKQQAYCIPCKTRPQATGQVTCLFIYHFYTFRK